MRLKGRAKPLFLTKTKYMKKPLFKMLLFSSLLLGCQKGFSQQINVPTSIVGHFEISSVVGSVTNRTNVNYRLYPASVSGSLTVELNTPASRYLAVDIADASSTVLLSWAPTTNNNAYDHLFDVSALPSGSYQVVVKDSTGTLNTVPFTKP
jgi:hypothetical protein